MTKLLPVALLLASTCSAIAEDNWHRFRGPDADGVAPDNPGLPITWTNTENVKWAVDVPGWGWSCPIVWGDRVYLSTVVSDEENLTPSKACTWAQVCEIRQRVFITGWCTALM